MNWYPIIILMFAAVSLYMGCYYIALYILHRDQPENLPFSLSCFIAAILDITNAGLYSSASLAEGISWERWNFVEIPLITITMLWFVHVYTKSTTKKIIYGLYGLLILSTSLAFITHPLTISLENAVPKQFMVASLFKITYYQAKLGIFIHLQLALSCAALFYGSYILLKFYIKNKKETLPLIICMSFFFIGALNDFFVASDIYEFLYMSELTYLIVILGMNYSMLRRFVSVHNGIKELNSTLEKKVRERTRELESAKNELQVTATKDLLTGLFNRHELITRIEVEISRIQRYGEKPLRTFSLLFIDLDDFKYYNDTFGHQAGDIILKEFASLIRSVTRNVDICVRFGGDEFIIILPETSSNNAVSIVDHINDCLKFHKYFIPDLERYLKNTITVPEEYTLGFSTGITEYKPGMNMDSLLNIADKALYSAKKNGKNQCVISLDN